MKKCLKSQEKIPLTFWLDRANIILLISEREVKQMKLKLKDFIIVSLLGVVGFVISMASGMATQLFGAYGVFVHVSIGSFLCAPVYFVMCNKIPKRGAIFIYYFLSGIIYSIMGFIPMLPIMAVSGIVGELLVGRADNYINMGRLSLSYVISQLIYSLHGFFFILVLGVEGLVKTFPNLFTLAVLGTLFGKYIYKKFFDKTGDKRSILS